MISKIKHGVNIIEKPIKKNKAAVLTVQVTIKNALWERLPLRGVSLTGWRQP